MTADPSKLATLMATWAPRSRACDCTQSCATNDAWCASVRAGWGKRHRAEGMGHVARITKE
eukprot:8070540-Alexandrium_andersonii.AAC.1